jgi:Na+/H+ antiporter
MESVESVEIVLAMLLAVAASGYLVRALPFSLPLPLAQIALGAAVTETFGHGVTLDPQLFFLLFLPPLLFLDGWRIPNDGLRRDRAVILELALGLVVFTILGAGFLIHWLIPSMPLPVAFALAAIVSPTDPVAVSSIAARVPIPKRLMHILEGESLFNDASGLVCFRFAVAAVLTGQFSVATASLTFVWVAGGGLALGVVTTLAVSFAQRAALRRFDEASSSSILVSLLLPFGAYMLAEQMRASGILAAVGAGITMSQVELSGRLRATTRVQRAAVWDTVQFTLNGVMFVLLGEQLPEVSRSAALSVEQIGHRNPWWLLIYVLAINVGLALLRFVWVWTSLRLTLFRARHRSEPATAPPRRLVVATSLAGVRGAITLAGVLTLPLHLPDGTPFPARALTIFLSTAVILVSLMVASFGLPPLLRGLALPEGPSEEHANEERARREAANAAIAAVEAARRAPIDADANADVYSEAARRVIGIYQRRLETVAEPEGAGGQLRKVARAEGELRLEGLKAEREAIFALARQQKLSDATARKLVREVDLLEARHR